jgi:taurine dioxygenase
MPELKPLGPYFGAEITGLRLDERFEGEAAGFLAAAWRRYLVLVLRDQALTPAAMLALGHRLGELDLAPPLDAARSHLDGYPEIAVVSNVVENGEAIGGLGHGELAWHSDMTFREEPPVACALHAVEVPDGGDTHFLSLVDAAAHLPKELRQQIDGLRLRHDRRYTSAGTPRRDSAGEPAMTHELLSTDPLSGRPCLLLGRRLNSEVVGLDEAAGRSLHGPRWRQLEDPALTLRHVWRPGDLVLWGNLAVMHRRDAFDAAARRILHRLQFRRLLATAPAPLA